MQNEVGAFYELCQAIAYESALEMLMGPGKVRDLVLCMYAMGCARGYKMGLADGIEGYDPAGFDEMLKKLLLKPADK